MPLNVILNSVVIVALIAFLSAVCVFFCRKYMEKRSINRAILAEIKRLIHVVTVHRDWWERLVRDRDTDYPLIPFSHAVYTKQVKDIGLLKGDVVERVVVFYGSLDFINSLQACRSLYDPTKSTKDGTPMPDVFNKQYLDVLNRFIKDFELAFAKEFRDLA